MFKKTGIETICAWHELAALRAKEVGVPVRIIYAVALDEVLRMSLSELKFRARLLHGMVVDAPEHLAKRQALPDYEEIRRGLARLKLGEHLAAGVVGVAGDDVHGAVGGDTLREDVAVLGVDAPRAERAVVAGQPAMGLRAFRRAEHGQTLSDAVGRLRRGFPHRVLRGIAAIVAGTEGAHRHPAALAHPRQQVVGAGR